MGVPPSLPAPRQKAQRRSMLVERSPPPLPPIRTSGSHPEGFGEAAFPPSPKTKRSIVRRLSLTKLFRRTVSSNSNNHNSTNGHTSPVLATPPAIVPFIAPTESSPPLPIRSSSVSYIPPPQPTFVSAIPDNIMNKLRDKVQYCTNGSLPLRVYGQLIDVSSQTGSSILKNLVLTKSTIILAVFDTSEENYSPIDQLMSELHSLRLDPETPNIATILLVGTHSDKHSSAVVAKEKLDRVRLALRSSRYGRFLSTSSFIVSCSSLFDHSTIEDVKKYIVDLVKKKCQWKIPLRWLRCLRRFQNMSSNGQYFVSYGEAQNIVNEVCMCKKAEEVDEIIQFLHSQLIIASFDNIPALKSTIITDPSWLVTSFSKILGLAEPTVESTIPSILKPDYKQAITQGTISEHLLEYLWPSSTRSSKQELLKLMNTLELINLIGLGSHPISPWESERSLVSSQPSTPSVSPTVASPTSSVITSVVLSSIVQEPLPEDMSHSSIEPLYFFCSDSLFPLSLIFLRLVNRCVQSHASNSFHYKDASCFLINPSVVLLIRRRTDCIQISLSPSHHHSTTSSSSPDSSSASSHSTLPTGETAMTVLMFIQAAFSDVCKQWFPSLMFYPRLLCSCSSKRHYIVFDSTLCMGQYTKCQKGFKVYLPPLTAPWLGEDVAERYVGNIAPKGFHEDDGKCIMFLQICCVLYNGMHENVFVN